MSVKATLHMRSLPSNEWTFAELWVACNSGSCIHKSDYSLLAIPYPVSIKVISYSIHIFMYYFPSNFIVSSICKVVYLQKWVEFAYCTIARTRLVFPYFTCCLAIFVCVSLCIMRVSQQTTPHPGNIHYLANRACVALPLWKTLYLLTFHIPTTSVKIYAK